MIEPTVLEDILRSNRLRARAFQAFARSNTLVPGRSCAVTGLRGSGKTALLFTAMQALAAKGHAWETMVYLNCESEELFGFDAGDFEHILATASKNGSPFLFFDEIRALEGWEQYVSRALEANIPTVITASGAKLPVDGALTESLNQLTVFPMSFREYLDALGISDGEEALHNTRGRGRIIAAFEDYLRNGGFPETVPLPPLEKLERTEDIYRSIYLRDIALAGSIRHVQTLRVLLAKTAQGVGMPLSLSRLAAMTAGSSDGVPRTTVSRYIESAVTAGLLLPVSEYSKSGASGQRKYYFADNGILNLLRRDAPAALLENLAALTLLRRYGPLDKVFFARERAAVDFFVSETQLAVKICPHPSELDSRVRAVRELEKFSPSMPVGRRLILTMYEESAIQSKAGPIEIKPVWKWLLEEMPF